MIRSTRNSSCYLRPPHSAIANLPHLHNQPHTSYALLAHKTWWSSRQGSVYAISYHWREIPVPQVRNICVPIDGPKAVQAQRADISPIPPPLLAFPYAFLSLDRMSNIMLRISLFFREMMYEYEFHVYFLHVYSHTASFQTR